MNLLYENDNNDLWCYWDFWNWVFTTTDTEKKCNPWYVKYLIWEHKIKFKIYDKNYTNNYKELFLEFENLLNKKLETLTWYDSWIVSGWQEDIKYDFWLLKNIKLWNILVNPKWVDFGLIISWCK